MNRIAGILDLNNREVLPQELRRMVEVIKPSGETQVLAEKNAGLACILVGENRCGANHLVNVSQCGHTAIVFDGRLDNRKELQLTLRPQLHARRDDLGDGAVVLAAYQKWGTEFPKYLIGDFALAIWDDEEHQMICVRDHFGVRPLYYSYSKKEFLFSSSPDAILASMRVPSDIFEERLSDVLIEYAGGGLEGVDKTCSFYRNIFRLPPAHMLIVRTDGMTIRRYWELDHDQDASYANENENIAIFSQRLEEAVRCRLDSSYDVAAMLSGGMDSSSIVGMARRICTRNGNPLNVISVQSGMSNLNRETDYIKAILEQGNVRAHIICEADLDQNMDVLIKAIEDEAEPFDCLMNLSRLVYLQAGNQNFKAVLDGIDGDALLQGSGHLVQLWRERNLFAIYQETLKAGGNTAEFKAGRRLFIDSFVSAYLPIAPDWYRKIRHPVRYQRIAASIARQSIINREFVNHTQLQERFAKLHSNRSRQPSFRQIDFHKSTLNHPFLTLGLERYERVAGTFGIEARHPLTDLRLVEFCLGLPWQLKTQHGWRKYIMRRAMEPYLPQDVVWRRDKDSLMWEFNRLILKNRAEYFHQATLDEKQALLPYVDTHKLEKIWQEYLTEDNEKNAELIWSGIALAFWLRRHRNMIRDLKLQQ